MTRVVLALAVVIALTTPASAEIYRYTDDRGNSYYVEGLENVPQSFRAGAVPLGMRSAPAAPAPVQGAPGAPGRPPGPVPGAPQPSSTPGSTSIRYTPGRPIMVDVRINGNATAQLLLDTGADTTMISPRALVAAGASISRPVGTARVTGVAGSDNVSFVTIDSLEIGEARVGRMRVASYDISGAGDGLLGRDFLDRFNLTIDSSNGVVKLDPK